MSWRLGRKKWYDKEWKMKKRELRKAIRDLRKKRLSREDFIVKRREYKE